MLYRVLRNLRNYFVIDRYEATYTINKGTVSLPFAEAGQYILIEGSKFNDGIYCYPLNDLRDETFNGAVCTLTIPPDLLQLVAEMEEWEAKHTASEFTSESFGGYSYQRPTAGAGAFTAFRERLKVYRKI